MTDSIKIAFSRVLFMARIAPSLGMTVVHDQHTDLPIGLVITRFNYLTDADIVGCINFAPPDESGCVVLTHEIRDHDGEGDLLDYDPMVSYDQGEEFVLQEFLICFADLVHAEHQKHDRLVKAQIAKFSGMKAVIDDLLR